MRASCLPKHALRVCRYRGGADSSQECPPRRHERHYGQCLRLPFFLFGASVSEPARPILRYHGGKWKIADWIIEHLPRHRTYVEPFGGAASVLIKKPRAYAEVYNDLDGEIVNLFCVARDRGEELARAVELTPYARDEFYQSFLPSDDPLEQARRTVLRSFAGFGGKTANWLSWGLHQGRNYAGF
jgi:DNA adenine methylase